MKILTQTSVPSLKCSKSDRLLESPRLRAVTLLELLAGLSILLVLLLLVVPVTRSVRTTTLANRCAAQLRQLHLAVLAFAEDHQGRVPPALGSSSDPPPFNYNSYWWNQAYLGRYAVGPLNRRRDNAGGFTQEEAAIYNCPARLAAEPDSRYTPSNGNPAISYLMVKLPKEWQLLRSIPEPSKTVLFTEGRSSTLTLTNCQTGPLGSPSAAGRLRRYHQDGLHLLYYDGHLTRFAGRDEELPALLRPAAP